MAEQHYLSLLAEFSSVSYTDVEEMAPIERVEACKALNKRVKEYNDAKKKEAAEARASAARARAKSRAGRHH